ncbi:hypothetical protein J4212_01830 [Candidatus Woesearchaeota archaeon]|nr:hypothetical protein [Candidatus Woesearchaeota archaeon]
MGLIYEIVPSVYFLEQLKSLKDKSLIESKLHLVKISPFRFKALEGYKFVFAVKLRLNGYKRLIYLVEPKERKAFIFGLFERKKDYKDFERFYKRYLKEK